MRQPVVILAMSMFLVGCVAGGSPGPADQQTRARQAAMMNEAQAAAEAGKNRAGDENMSCSALQREFMKVALATKGQAAGMSGAAQRMQALQGRRTALSAAEKAQAEADSNAMMAASAGMMPDAARGQRLYELGRAKDCPFARG